jgi:hypothetical protein
MIRYKEVSQLLWQLAVWQTAVAAFCPRAHALSQEPGSFITGKRPTCLRRQPNGCQLAEPKNWKSDREGLGRRGLLTWHGSLRHGVLLDREERHARLAIQYENMTRFGTHSHRRHSSPFPLEGKQVMMDGLEGPHQFASRSA